MWFFFVVFFFNSVLPEPMQQPTISSLHPCWCTPSPSMCCVALWTRSLADVSFWGELPVLLCSHRLRLCRSYWGAVRAYSPAAAKKGSSHLPMLWLVPQALASHRAPALCSHHRFHGASPDLTVFLFLKTNKQPHCLWLPLCLTALLVLFYLGPQLPQHF